MAAKRKKKRVIAYDIKEIGSKKLVERINVQDKGERHADKVMDGLCLKVDFDRFFIETVKG